LFSTPLSVLLNSRNSNRKVIQQALITQPSVAKLSRRESRCLTTVPNCPGVPAYFGQPRYGVHPGKWKFWNSRKGTK